MPCPGQAPAPPVWAFEIYDGKGDAASSEARGEVGAGKEGAAVNSPLASALVCF